MVEEISLLKADNDLLRQKIITKERTIGSLQDRLAQQEVEWRLGSSDNSNGNNGNNVNKEDIQQVLKSYIKTIEEQKLKLRETEDQLLALTKDMKWHSVKYSAGEQSPSKVYIVLLSNLFFIFVSFSLLNLIH